MNVASFLTRTYPTHPPRRRGPSPFLATARVVTPANFPRTHSKQVSGPPHGNGGPSTPCYRQIGQVEPLAKRRSGKGLQEFLNIKLANKTRRNGSVFSIEKKHNSCINVHNGPAGPLDFPSNLPYLDRDWYICLISSPQPPRRSSLGPSPPSAIPSPFPPASRRREWW